MKLNFIILLCILTGLFSSAQNTKHNDYYENKVQEYLKETKFEKQIAELLKHSDNDFEDIKGDEIEIDGISTNDHKSKLELEGAKENKITSSLWTRFEAVFPAQKDSAAAFSSFNKMSVLIKNAMGDKSTVKTSPLKEVVSGFDISKTMINEFRKHENKTDAYYVELKIYRSVSKMSFMNSSEGWKTELIVYKKLEY